MDGGRLAKLDIEWKQKNKIAVGRPRDRWLDGAGKAMERRGVQLMDVEEDKSYEYRDAWRDVVKCSPADR